jgi:Leucine-rich repeat (LRR) protein
MNLTGKLPSTLSNLVQLQFLELNFNSLTGHLPADVYSMKSLLYLNTYKNHFTGTISTEIGLLTNLLFMGFMENRFTGTIPTEVGYLSKMREIYIYANFFSGTIPSAISVMDQLSTLDVFYNELTGTIPLELSSLSLLFNFEVTRNLLSGPVPSFFGRDLILLKYLELSENLFTGTIGPQLGNLTQLSELDLEHNYLTGSLFRDLNGLDRLVTLSISSNYFSRSLPSTMVDLAAVSNILLSGNLMTGGVDILFSNLSGKLTKLSVVDISNNGFTGLIPVGLLTGRSRISVAMVKNCFHGSLSEAVCVNAPFLKDIAMDGLSAGDFCRQYTFAGVLSSYTSNLMTGSVPLCLYGLPSLETLQLSGNGFTGSLPSCGTVMTSDGTGSKCSNPISRNMTTLILSHNRISGTIPHVFQTYPFDNLDLSYNRISGTATNMSNFFDRDDNAELALQVNRLSGDIPTGFQQARNISILDGNLFGCRTLGDLPVYDPQYATAQCGSTQLYQIVIVYCCCLFFAFALFGYIRLYVVVPASCTSYWVKAAGVGSSALSEEQQVRLSRELDQSSQRHQDSSDFVESVINSEFSYRLENDLTGREALTAKRQWYQGWCKPGGVVAYVGRRLDYVLTRWKGQFGIACWAVSNFPSEIAEAVNISRKYITFLEWIRRFCCLSLAVIVTVFLGTFFLLKFIDDNAYSTHTYDYGWLPSIAFLLGRTPGMVIAIEIMLSVVFLYFALTGIALQLRLSPIATHQSTPESRNGNHGLVPTSAAADKVGPHYGLPLQRRIRLKLREFLVIMADVIIMVTANSRYSCSLRSVLNEMSLS